MSLRVRLLLALAPLVLLLVGLGVAGYVQLDRTGGRIDAILRENYESVRAMYHLNEAAERIDSSFRLALAGEEDAAAKSYADNWAEFDRRYSIEANNVTIHPIEDELVARLRALKDDYRGRGDQFFARPPGSPERAVGYFGRPGDAGLRGVSRSVKETADEILRINHESMQASRDDARATARTALLGFGVSWAVVVLLLAFTAAYLLRTILSPIRAVTDAAQAAAESGQLDRRVPEFGRDELGRLARAFNAMTGQLRAYRRTDLAKLVRAQRTAQATIDSFPDPVLVLDPAGRVEQANPAARQVFGVAPADAPNASPWLPPDALRDPVRDALEVQRASAAESFDQAVTFRLGGADRAYLPQVRPIRDPAGDTLGAAVVLADVTRFRLLDQFKTDLVATVSHELKTPLTSVRLAVHVLLEETVGPLTPKQTELLADARDSAERLLGLIDQLLALARLQRPGGGERRPEDPGELLRRAADAVRPRADDKHVGLVVRADPPLPQVTADADRIVVALGNLLENAVTYTPPGGRVTASASASPSGRVEFAVADTGVGIPTEHLPDLFERFFRVPGQSDPAGTGLGLAIVKEVAAAHGGDVTCESSPAAGSVFRLTLPAANAPA